MCHRRGRRGCTPPTSSLRIPYVCVRSRGRGVQRSSPKCSFSAAMDTSQAPPPPPWAPLMFRVEEVHGPRGVGVRAVLAHFTNPFNAFHLLGRAFWVRLRVYRLHHVQHLLQLRLHLPYPLLHAYSPYFINEGQAAARGGQQAWRGWSVLRWCWPGPVFFAGPCSVRVSIIYPCRVKSTVMYSAYMQVKISNICVCW
jgi:hypothetical protein